MFVIASVAKAPGHPVEDMTLSRSTIRRSRMTARELISATDMETFHTQCPPILLHWDGKLLPDISQNKEVVDRIAIIVTGVRVEKLQAVPKIGTGTGKDQAVAFLKILEDWKIKEKVHGLVFDTTSSNTGIHKGASTLIEDGIGHELVHIGCRHHIMEVVLGHVFTSLFGATSGPNFQIFKRFQKHWSLIEQVNYSPAEDGLFAPFTGETQTLRQEMIAFYFSAASH